MAVEAPGRQSPTDGTLTASRQLAMQALRLDLAASTDSAGMQAQRQEWSVPTGFGGYVDQSVKPMASSTRDAVVTAVRSPAEGRIAQGVLLQGADFEAEGAVPMRLHLEISEAGGHLWIGAAQANPEQIAQAVAYVRQRLAARGIGLADITCNGKSWNGNLTLGAEQAPQVNYPIEGERNGNGR
jgi:hypothetical protein